MISISVLLEQLRARIESRSAPAVPLPVPLCPDCRHSMVLRRSARGPFWGCSRYVTGCRGTRRL